MKKNSRIISLGIALAILLLVVAVLTGVKSCVDKRKTEAEIISRHTYAALHISLPKETTDHSQQKTAGYPAVFVFIASMTKTPKHDKDSAKPDTLE